MKKVVIILSSIIILFIMLLMRTTQEKNNLQKKYDEMNGNRIWDVYSLIVNTKNLKMENVVLTISNDYKTQKRSGGSVYILDKELLKNVSSITKEICYKTDETCDFAGRDTHTPASDEYMNKSYFGIGELRTSWIPKSLITNNGETFKKTDDFMEKLHSMYLKVTIEYGDGSQKVIKDDIKVNRKFGTDHSKKYALEK